MQTIFVWAGLGLFSFILTMLAFIHAVIRIFPSKGEKTFWIIITLFPFLGWIIYFSIGSWRGRKQSEK